MHHRTLAICALTLAVHAGAQSPEVRVVVSNAGVPRETPVRVIASEGAVPNAVQKSVMRALRQSGLTVVADEQPRPGESRLLLAAQCSRSWFGPWRCASLTARLVHSETGEVLAIATRNVLAANTTRLSVIEDALREGLSTSPSTR